MSNRYRPSANGARSLSPAQRAGSGRETFAQGLKGRDRGPSQNDGSYAPMGLRWRDLRRSGHGGDPGERHGYRRDNLPGAILHQLGVAVDRYRGGLRGHGRESPGSGMPRMDVS
jgi:hypothetical protein